MAFCIVPDARLAVLFPVWRARCCAGAKNLDRESWSRLPVPGHLGGGYDKVALRGPPLSRVAGGETLR